MSLIRKLSQAFGRMQVLPGKKKPNVTKSHRHAKKNRRTQKKSRQTNRKHK